MTGERWTGWRRSAITVAIVAGLVATSGLDVAVASVRRSHQAAERRHLALVREEQRYLRELRSLADDVTREVIPVQRVLGALSTPRPADIYAARDALGTSDSLSAVQALLARAGRIHVPRPWTADGRYVVKSLAEFVDALNEMRRQRPVKDPRTLNADLLGTDTAKLSGAQDDWSSALRRVFVRGGQKPPRTPYPGIPMRVPTVMATWAFAADRACVAADIAIVPVLHRLDQSHSDKDLHRAAAIEHGMTAKIRGLDLPRRGRRSLRTLLYRLRILDAEA